jgi:mannose-6-phosphate isomerase
MEIIFFEPIFKDYLWGGNRLKSEFNKQTPYEVTAESWEISANTNGKTIVRNGKYKGLNLEELFDKKEVREEIFGTKCADMEAFPLLIKFIDANKNLSVQVHPNDEYALKNENGLGKTEMWYVMDCKENAQIICGVKDNISQDEIKQFVQAGKIEEILNYIDIQKGESILIKPGTLHAIMEGTLICEIQQNSDITYRVFDWNRVDKNGNSRELHIQKTLDVIDINSKTDKVSTENIEEQRIADCDYFKVDKIEIKNEYLGTASKESFIVMNVVDGEGKISYMNFEQCISKGDSFIIPANLGEFKIEGDLTILKSYI